MLNKHFTKKDTKMANRYMQRCHLMSPVKYELKQDTTHLLGFPGVSAVNICLQCRRTQFDSWVGKIPWRMAWQPTPVFICFPGGSDANESASTAGDMALIPGLGRYPGGGHGNPLQYSCLENPTERGT